jgi:hypothetical protein
VPVNKAEPYRVMGSPASGVARMVLDDAQTAAQRSSPRVEGNRNPFVDHRVRAGCLGWWGRQ